MDVVTRSLIEISKVNEVDFKFIGESCWTLFGGSGFVGRWLAASLLYCSKALDVELDVKIVTRDKSECESKFQKFFPKELAFPQIITVDQFFQSSHYITKCHKSNYYVFGATPTTNFSQDLLKVSEYFQRIVKTVSNSDNPPTFLNLSSGAVYKNAFGNQEFILENDERQEISQTVNLYQKCKLSVESILFNATKEGIIKGLNPRLFTFAGPGFPLDSHFAVSNFVKSALGKKDIIINGHRKTSRSYMDPADMVIWLLRLVRLQNSIGLQPIHIGSDFAYSIDELAEQILKIFGTTPITYNDKSAAIPNSYVPSTKNTRKLLDVDYKWNLESTLTRWREYLTGFPGIKDSKWE